MKRLCSGVYKTMKRCMQGKRMVSMYGLFEEIDMQVPPHGNGV